MSFVDRLARLCALEPSRSKWVFVPGRALGHTLGERLAREHGSWANIRWVTPLDVATRMAGPFLVDQGIEPSDEALGPALMMRLLLDLPEQDGYFRPMAEQPSMASVLWQTVAELRLAGVRSTHLSRSRFVSPHKHRELEALLAAYERYLEERHIADAATVFELAARQAAFCPIVPRDMRIEWPEVIWPPLVRRFLEALPGEIERVDVPGIPRLAVPRRVASPGPVSQPPGPSAWYRLFTPETIPEDRGGDVAPIEIFHAGGREAEIEEVCRRILSSGVPLDDVEIACGSEAHAWLAWEKAVRLEWPVTVGTGVPATMTRPGRAVLGWCDWIDGEFAATRLRRLLLAGDVVPREWTEVEELDVAMTAGQGARLLLRLGAAWGKGSYAAAFARARLQRRSRLRGDDVDETRRSIEQIFEQRFERLESWLELLLADVPEPDLAGNVGAHDMAAAALAFIRNNALRTSALDASSFVAIEDCLNELNSLDSFQGPRRLMLRLIRERVESLRVGADRARPGCLHVSSLASAGLAGRDRLFVVGLEEGRVFPASIEDSVLLDEERAVVHTDLRQSADRLDESVFAIVHRLVDAATSARHGACLSFSCRDTREFRETFPSWLVLQAFRLRQRNGALTYRDLAAWLGEPASAIPRRVMEAHTDSAWWLTQARCTPAATTRAALAAFPFLERGREAARVRASNEFTAWDGHVPEAGVLLDPASPARVLSASTLEGAAACAFRYFLRQGLGVMPLEENDRDPDVWLDPLTRGRELHDLFADVMRQLRAERRRPCPEDIEPFLQRGDQRLAQLRVEMPPPSDDVFNAEREEFLHDLRLFMQAECNREGRDPLAFEVTFGLPTDNSATEPLSLASSVAIPLPDGRTMHVHGRIDRIDRIGPDTFETVDYKTGRYWAEGWRGIFAKGRRLQHALYARAAEAMLAAGHPGATVVQSTYYFPTRRGLRWEFVIPTPTNEVLGALLAHLADVLTRGAFAQAQESRTCEWCEFAAACGARPWEIAARKASAQALEPLRSLLSYD